MSIGGFATSQRIVKSIVIVGVEAADMKGISQRPLLE